VTKSGITSYLVIVSYRLFGKVTPYFRAFEKIYQRSGITRLYDSYVALMFFFSSVTFFLTFGIVALLHHFFFDLPVLQYFLAVFVFSSSITLTVPIAFIVYPLYRKSQGRKVIDTNLIYTTGFMGILSAGGISIERILERVAQLERHAAIKDLAKRFLTNTKMFGLDMTSALKDITVHSPSETFSKLFVGLINTVKTSGDIKSFLLFETRRLLQEKREQLKKTLGTLTILSELYISSLVVGPIVFIVILTILSIMGNVVSGLSPAEQLNLLVFFGLPAMSTSFIVILNAVLPEEE